MNSLDHFQLGMIAKRLARFVVNFNISKPPKPDQAILIIPSNSCFPARFSRVPPAVPTQLALERSVRECQFASKIG
jgi:hypothetical protein